MRNVTGHGKWEQNRPDVSSPGGRDSYRLLVGTCNTLVGLSLILGDAILEDLGHKLILNPGAITY